MYIAFSVTTMDTSAPLLLIDGSYAIIHRFTALQRWYKLSHPDEADVINHPEYDWSGNISFMSKLRERFLTGFDKVCKEFEIPKQNMLVALDQSRASLWRTQLLPSYKATRPGNSGFGKALKHFRNVWLPEYTQELGIKVLATPTLEADDVIAVLCKYAKTRFPKVVIVTNDKDCVQLSSPDVHIENLQGKVLQPAGTVEKMLLEHVLRGDSCDNVPPCMKGRVKGKPTVPQLLADQTLLDHFLATDEQFRICYKRNRTLIDFDFIPQEAAAATIAAFCSLC